MWFSSLNLRAKSKFGAVLDDPGFQALMTTSISSSHTELAFAMLYERNLPKSHWHPYIQMLPVLDPDNAGEVWTRWGEEQREQLHPSPPPDRRPPPARPPPTSRCFYTPCPPEPVNPTPMPLCPFAPTFHSPGMA